MSFSSLISPLRRSAKYLQKQVRKTRVRTTSVLRELAYLRTRLHLPRNDAYPLATCANDGVSVQFIDPEAPFTRPLPSLPGETSMHETFTKERTGTYPASFVITLRQGRFWGFYGGTVLTADGRIIHEVSKDVWGPHLHSALTRISLPAPRLLKGKTLSLVTPEAAKNYHHWTVDVLPRAGLVQRAGYRLSDFDQVLIKDSQFPYQRESFRQLGIDERKLIRVQDSDHFVAESLTIPSLHLDNTRVNAADLRFVRALYLPSEPAPGSGFRRLYLSRRDAAFRRVTNEVDLLPLLARHGFEEVFMSGRSVAEQAKLFSEADIILAPDGAAMANLVFAPAGCRVIELFAPGWVVPYFWMISAHLQLDYTALIGTGPRPAPGVLPSDLQQDISIPIERIEQLLASLPPAKSS